MNNLDYSVASASTRCANCSFSDLCEPTDTLPYYEACAMSCNAVNSVVTDLIKQLKARSMLVAVRNSCQGNDFEEVVSMREIEHLLGVVLEVFKS